MDGFGSYIVSHFLSAGRLRSPDGLVTCCIVCMLCVAAGAFLSCVLQNINIPKIYTAIKVASTLRNKVKAIFLTFQQ